jgi:hypothetical protein
VVAAIGVALSVLRPPPTPVEQEPSEPELAPAEPAYSEAA